jgi:DNA-binding SARP family transcriptional activator/tetratricopeptide (TPR) repeat protein
VNDDVMKVCVLGDTTVESNGRSYAPDATHVFAALLVLALQPQHRMTRQRLAALLWSDAPSNRRAERLRWLLSKMRGLGVPLQVTPAEVRLSPSAIEIDYVALLAALEVATPEALPRLDAVDAVFGNYEPDFSPAFRRWLEDQRDAIGDELLTRLVPMLSDMRQRGNWAATERIGRAIRRVSPLHEEATLAIAEALCAAGDKAHGIRVLDEYLGEVRDEDSPMRVPAELLRRRMSVSTDPSGSATQSVPFVGRLEQLQRFQSLLAQATAGRGAALLFCGPAGIGKTRLLDETASFAASVGRASVVRARCQPGDALRPLSGLADVIPKLLDLRGAAGCEPSTLDRLARLSEIEERGETELANRAASALLRNEIRDACFDLLAAVSQEQTLVVQIDDFQWSDPTLSWLWDSIMSYAKEQRILWCFGARLDQPHEADALFPRDARALIINEWLLAFGREDAGLFLDKLLPDGRGAPSREVRDALLERGGGVPLALLELVRHWQTGGAIASVPASLAAAMDARLARLTPTARRTLQVSALLGTFSTLERLERVLQLPRSEFVDALAQLESTGILATDHAGATHGHVLWAEASLSHLEPSVALVLHRHVAEQFDGELQATPSPAFLWESARHWEAGGQTDRARAAVVRGAEHLARNGLYPEAAEAYRRAIDQSRDGEQQRNYTRQRIELFRLSGSWSKLPAEIDRHERLSRTIEPAYGEHSDLEAIRRHALYQIEGPSTALAEGALACASDARASNSHRLQASYDCIRYGEEGERRDILDEGYRILKTLTPVTPEDVQHYSLGHVQYNIVFGDQQEAARVSRAWLDYERAAGDRYRLAWSAKMAGWALETIGDIDGARIAYLESLTVARDARLRLMQTAAYDLLVGLEIEYGDLQKARQLLEQWWSECEPFDHEVPLVGYTIGIARAQLALAEGDGAEALRRLPNEPALAGARLARMLQLSFRLSAIMLVSPGASEAHELARELAPLLEIPGYQLGPIAAGYAEYLDMYHGTQATDAFMRRFMKDVWRELRPTRRLAPFVERVLRSQPPPALRTPQAALHS